MEHKHQHATTRTCVLLCVVFLVWLCGGVAAQDEFVCDSGTLDTVCFVNTSRVVPGNVEIDCNSITITQGTVISSTAKHGLIQINANDTLILQGSIVAYSVSVSANSIVIEDTGLIKNVLDPSPYFIGGTVVYSTMNITISGSIQANYVSIRGEDVYILETGSVNTNGLGAYPMSGDGQGYNATQSIPAGGGSYGGYSIIPGYTVTNGAPPYEPLGGASSIGGSGGGSDGDNIGGASGGLVTVVAKGTLTVLGNISADGAAAQGRAGGGSGGSISVSALIITGSGFITADGGTSQSGGLGSGGRISVSVTKSITNSPTIQAAGAASSASQAGAGTVDFTNSRLLFITNGYAASTPATSAFTGVTPLLVTDDYEILIKYYDVQVANSAILLPFNDSLITNSLTFSNGAAMTCLQCNASGQLTARAAISIDTTSNFVMGDNWQINAESVKIAGAIFGSGLEFNVDSMIVTGSIVTDGNGFGPTDGPGAGSSGQGSMSGGGAGHGASGMTCSSSLGGVAYQVGSYPDSCGSGGGNAGVLLGGAGGGSISIFATTLTLNGSLSANGLPGADGSIQNAESGLLSNVGGAGGGSGGSIYINCSNLFASATASITANGGKGGANGGGGGAGGLLRFEIGSSQFSGSFLPSVLVNGGLTQCNSSVANGVISTQCSPGSSVWNSPIQCQPCDAGEYSVDGTACQACPAGTATSLTGQVSCTLCSAGSVSSQNGSQTCTLCPAGSYAPQTGLTACSACDNGYISAAGASICNPCGPGTFSSNNTCTACNIGQFSNLSANAECTQCPLGTTQPYSGKSICILCSAGSASNDSLYCDLCGPGTFSNDTGLSECTACPSGTYMPVSGGTQCKICESSHSIGATNCANPWLQFPKILYWSIPVGAFVLAVVVGLLLKRFCCKSNAYHKIPDDECPSVNSTLHNPVEASDQSYQNPREERKSVEISEDAKLLLEKYQDLVLKLNACHNMLKEIEEAERCMVCCENRKCVALVPCGHVVYCSDCAPPTNLCPVCNTRIARTYGPVYF